MRQLSNNLQVAAGTKGAKSQNGFVPHAHGGTEKTVIDHSLDDSAIAAGTQNPFLVDHSQLPPWSQDNAWIIRGYRRPGGVAETEAERIYEHNTVYKCCKSVWAYWHNETGKSCLTLPICISTNSVLVHSQHSHTSLGCRLLHRTYFSPYPSTLSPSAKFYAASVASSSLLPLKSDVHHRLWQSLASCVRLLFTEAPSY